MVVSCLPSFRVLLSARQSDSAYKRRNPSGSGSTPRSLSFPYRNSAIRLNPMRHGTFLDPDSGDRESVEHLANAESEESPNPEISKTRRRTESQERILAKIPKGSIGVQNDIVSFL